MAGLPDLEFVLFRGYDVTGLARGLVDDLENNVEEHDVAGESLLTSRFVGGSEATLQLTGFYDETLSPVFEAKTAGVLMYVLDGNTAGHGCECSESALPTGYKRTVEAKACHKAEINWRLQGDVAPLDHATLIAPLAARGAAGNTQGAYVDLSAGSSSGGRWWVGLTALTLGGYTNVIVKAQHSTDHVTWGDITGATATFTAVGAQMASFSGTVNRYLAAAWSYTGAGTNPSATFAAALTQL